MRGGLAVAVFSAVLLTCMVSSAADNGGTRVPKWMEADDSVPVFRKSAAEVSVLVAVGDSHRRPVRNLRASDFSISDNGRAVGDLLEFQASENLPLRLGLLIDTSESNRAQAPPAEEAAAAFIRQALRSEQDRFFVAGFGTRAMRVPELTNNAESLASSRVEVKREGLTAFYDAVHSAAVTLERERGNLYRRALIVFSDGEDTVSFHGLQDALQMAERAEVSVYAISMKGRQRPQGEFVLRSLAAQTGGRAYIGVDAADLGGILNEIEHELRMQYRMSFRVEKSESDSGFHRLRIAVAVPDATARYRAGYFEDVEEVAKVEASGR